jgi:peptide deformylase
MRITNKTIIKDNNPEIRDQSQPVFLPLSEEDAQLLKDMFQYVKDSTNEELAKKYDLRPAVGISAIQVGVPKQLTAVIVEDLDKNGEPEKFEYMLANPRIVSNSVQKAYLKDGEGCLSVVEEHPGHVVRSARVTVKGYDLLTDQNVTIRARGYLAIVLQHELDHFKGTLFYDKIDPKDPEKIIPGALVI